MFRCDITGLVSQPREKGHRVVVETRPVTYENFRYNPETRETEIFTSTGTEIVRELYVSAAGLAILEDPDTREAILRKRA